MVWGLVDGLALVWYRPNVGHRWPNGGPLPAHRQPTFGPVLAQRWPGLGPPTAHRRPLGCRHYLLGNCGLKNLFLGRRHQSAKKLAATQEEKELSIENEE